MNLPIQNMNNNINTVDRYWKKESNSLFTLYIFFILQLNVQRYLYDYLQSYVLKSANHDTRTELMNRNEGGLVVLNRMNGGIRTYDIQVGYKENLEIRCNDY